MKLCVITPLAAFALAASAFGCSASKSNDTTTPDPGSLSDAGADTHHADSSGPDAQCAPGFTASQPCGRCGKQTRDCKSDGTWTDWTACTGEPKDAECSVGDTRPHACGNCGLRTDTCDPTACIWVNGATCSGEGECAPGTTDAKTCSTAGESQSRTCSDTCKWGDFSSCAVPPGWKPMGAAPSTFLGRVDEAWAWTGSDLVVFGGLGVSGGSIVMFGDGMKWSYATDTWTPIAAAPSALAAGRAQSTFAWTGTELVVWGGESATSAGANDGAAYNPTTNTWRTIAASPLSGRTSAQAVWSPTLKKLFVFGGWTGTGAADGAIYDPTADSWTMLPAAPIGGRVTFAAQWLDAPCNCLAVFGGYGGDVSGLKDGATFDPATSTWTKMADVPSTFDPRAQLASASIAGDLVIYGGYGGPGTDDWAKNDGARWSSATNTWTIFSGDDTALSPTAHRYDLQSWSDGKKIWIWSGATTSMPSAIPTGAAYDLSTKTWTTMPGVAKSLSARREAIVAWTGSVAIVWGGTDGMGKYFSDGATFAP